MKTKTREKIGYLIEEIVVYAFLLFIMFGMPYIIMSLE